MVYTKLRLTFVQLTSSAGKILLKKWMGSFFTFAVAQSEKGYCSCWRLGFESDDGRTSWETVKLNAQIWVWSIECNWIFIVTGFIVGCNCVPPQQSQSVDKVYMKCWVLHSVSVQLFGLFPCSFLEGFVFKIGFSVLLCLDVSSSLFELLQTEVNLSLFSVFHWQATIMGPVSMSALMLVVFMTNRLTKTSQTAMILFH